MEGQPEATAGGRAGGHSEANAISAPWKSPLPSGALGPGLEGAVGADGSLAPVSHVQIPIPVPLLPGAGSEEDGLPECVQWGCFYR